MNAEISNPTQEATANSTAFSKDLQNPQKPAASGTLDSSASAASPVASTFLSSASTTAQTSPAQGVSGVSDNSAHFSSDTALEQPAGTQEVGSGSDTVKQSIPPPNLTSAQVGGVHSTGEEKSSKRGSRGSIKVPSRRGSAASSKLSKKDSVVAPATSTQEKIIETELSSGAERPRKKGFSRFLSVLNCCSPSKDANVPDSHQAVPPKKARTLQANRGRQPTPMTKPNASAGESSKAESKEAIEDNIAGPPYSELTPAAKPKIIEPPKKEAPTMEKPLVSSDIVPSAESKVTPTQPTPTDQPLPPLPPDNKNDTTNTYGTFSEKSATSGTDGLVEPSVPPTAAAVEGEVSKEEMTINDRTPQQEARDIEMPDAPPIPPVPEQPMANQETTVQSPPQSNLPPPPPISIPNRPISTERQTSNGATTAEQQKWLLPPMADRFRGKKCLVLDLDETLVHSSFKILHQADFTIPVEIEGQFHNVYVIKRPGVDQFMKRVGELYEVVVFTASVAKYGDPLLDQLDIHNVVHHRLFRESCYNHQGNYVKVGIVFILIKRLANPHKDLSQVGRDLRETIIIDNSPTSYIFHPQHAVPISSWFSDAHDNELLDLIPVLEDLAGPQVRDVSLVLDVGL
ncbi:MAG: hypothetical protein Q9225_002396 [Loekoesia sp. 1 TL-2023]